MKHFILASGSARRQELLHMLDLAFDIVVPDIEEELNKNVTIEEAVMDLASQKASAVFKKYPDARVLGCDTIVVIGDSILGKPKNKDEARSMIHKLSGKTHRVITGCTLIEKGNISHFYQEASVRFSRMTDDEIEVYIATDEPYDKAGAYAIQGKAAKFIEAIEGDYYAVMGLPIQKIYEHLKQRAAL